MIGSSTARVAPPPATILYVANAARIGGGNRVLMDLMTHLDPQRYRPVLVAPGDGPLTEWARSVGIGHHVSRDGDWLSAAALLRRTTEFVRIIRRERAALVHSAAPTCYRALGLAGRLAGVPRICHLGFPPEAGELERSFLSPPEAVIGCYAGQAAAHEREILAMRSDCRVVGICNGIDTSRFRPDGDVQASRFRRGADHVVAILGHISHVKGHPTFVEAAGQLVRTHPNSRFLVIGADTLREGLQPELEARSAALGLASKLEFMGFRSDVPDILAAADVVALPSRSEGFPLAALEAMACGKPLVATPVGGVGEAVLDDVTGVLVPPDDAGRLAGAMARLLDDRPMMARMGRAARLRIEAEFSVEAFAQAVQGVYAGCSTASAGQTRAA